MSRNIHLVQGIMEPFPRLAFLRHFREGFTHPHEISLHQGPYTQLAADHTFPGRKILKQFFLPVDSLYHGQRKICAAVLLLCFRQRFYCFIKPAPGMGPASGNLQIFAFTFNGVVDLAAVRDAYPAEILQEFPGVAGVAGLLVFICCKTARLLGTYPQISDRCDPERKTTGLYTALGAGSHVYQPAFRERGQDPSKI